MDKVRYEGDSKEGFDFILAFCMLICGAETHKLAGWEGITSFYISLVVLLLWASDKFDLPFKMPRDLWQLAMVLVFPALFTLENNW